MNRNKLLFTIIVVIVFIIVVLISLLANLNTSKNNSTVNINKEEFFLDTNKIEEVKNRNEYYDVSQCLYRYFTYIREKNAAYLIGILDKDYIQKFSITKDNVYKYTYENDLKNLHYYIKNIKYKSDPNITQYVVNCKVLNRDIEDNIFFIVLFDNANVSFSILPVNEKYNDIEEVMLKTELKSIEKNEINTFIYNSIGDEMMCKYLLDDYINKALYFTRDAYDSLEEEYKNKRFKDYENFEKYIEENRNRLEVSDLNRIKQTSEFQNEEEYANYVGGLDRIYLSKYLVESNSESKKYVCLDYFGNYYMFNVKNVMDYNLTLDTYTIESEKFKSEYNNGNNQRKVQLNIDKFIKMINSKDYSHAYDVLDENFKNNYFKTEENFKKYIRNNFLEFNNINFEKFTEEGEIYIYQIVLSDKTSRSDKKIRMNVIMKLEEGTDFVMSFGVAN